MTKEKTYVLSLKDLNKVRASVPSEVWRNWNDLQERPAVMAGVWGPKIQAILEEEEGRDVRGNCAVCGRFMYFPPRHPAVWRNSAGRLMVIREHECGACWDMEGDDW